MIKKRRGEKKRKCKDMQLPYISVSKGMKQRISLTS